MKKTDDISNTNTLQPLYTIELTSEQIAYFEFLHRRTHGTSLKIAVESTVKDLIRNRNTVQVQNQRISQYTNGKDLSLKPNQKSVVQYFTQTLESTEPGKISNTTKYIQCTHNQEFLMHLLSEFVGSQHTFFSSIYPQFSEIEKSFSKTGEITTYATDFSITGFQYFHNSNLNVTEKLAVLHSEEEYKFNRDKNLIERFNKKMTISILDEKASVLFPQQTFPVLTKTENSQVFPLIPVSTGTQDSQQRTFLQQCFSNAAVVSINDMPFSFASINFESSEQKLLELCQSIFEEFHEVTYKTSTKSKEILRRELFEQYQQNFEDAVSVFIKEKITDNEWQEYIIEKLQPQLPALLQDEMFKDILSANHFLTFYDFKWKGNRLFFKETVQFFQINNSSNAFLSKNHTALFSLEITHIVNRDKKQTIDHSMSSLNLVMHEPLHNIIKVQDGSTPRYIQEVFPSLSHLLPRTLWKIASDSFSAISHAFSSCCSNGYQQPDEEIENTIEVIETKDWKNQSQQQKQNEQVWDNTKTLRTDKNVEQQHLISDVPSDVTDTSLHNGL